MRPDRRHLLALLAPGLALALWLVLGGVLVRMALDPSRRTTVDAALAPAIATHGMLVVGWWLIAAGLGAWIGHRLYLTYVAAQARLASAAGILVEDSTAPEVSAEGTGATRALAAAINSLAGQRAALTAEMARLVDEASRSVAEQRDQLAALMSELDQAVVVCNLDGRVLLYNAQVRELSHRLSPQGGGGAVIGLGRSIYSLVDRAQIQHAVETVERRLLRGADQSAVAAKFVTVTPAGSLLRVSLAPVRQGDEPRMTGFVLLLDDITIDQEVQSRRDRQLLHLTEASRASVASMQAALDLLDYPDLAADERDRFLAVVRDEVGAMCDRLAELSASSSQDMITRWPLQEMLGADLVAAARHRIEADTGQPVLSGEVDSDLWLSVDSFGIVQALRFLGARITALFPQPELWLRLVPAGSRAHLDLGWSVTDEAASLSPETLTRLQSEPMVIDGAPSPISVRDVVERHGGEVWLDREREDRRPFFRFLLPLAAAEATAPSAAWPSRPEFYDFDLFAAASGSGALDDQPLNALAFTVFDTETTGLDPSGGDEIIQIGAVRIVNGRILRGEFLDQLIDPRRSIPEAGIAIHGIHPHMVRAQPTIGEVLPVFHAFIGDSVLIGHNIAFDMRFLKLKEAETRIRFDQPLLDTLLLSSIVHPDETSHGLEAIAARLGITISGRHTALGDALATAELFVRLLPLLAQRGVTTLGQARAASGRSQFARLRY